jgi:parallel beta-helix repeat protein
MKRKHWWLAVALAVCLCGDLAWADSDFYVIPGGGGVGTKITSLPYNISKSGFYYLGGDLTTDSNGINVYTDNVTIDLMGFSVSSNKINNGFGIYIIGNNNVEVRNGTVRQFSEAIPGRGDNLRIINMRVCNNRVGIDLGGHDKAGFMSNNILVSGCMVSDSVSIGLSVQGYCINLINNEVSRCWMGIWVGDSSTIAGTLYSSGGNIIGNAACNNTDTGFALNGCKNFVIDRNSAFGNGTNWSGGGTGLIWGLNAGKNP